MIKEAEIKGEEIVKRAVTREQELRGRGAEFEVLSARRWKMTSSICWIP